MTPPSSCQRSPPSSFLRESVLGRARLTQIVTIRSIKTWASDPGESGRLTVSSTGDEAPRQPAADSRSNRDRRPPVSSPEHGSPSAPSPRRYSPSPSQPPSGKPPEWSACTSLRVQIGATDSAQTATINGRAAAPSAPTLLTSASAARSAEVRRSAERRGSVSACLWEPTRAVPSGANGPRRRAESGFRSTRSGPLTLGAEAPRLDQGVSCAWGLSYHRLHSVEILVEVERDRLPMTRRKVGLEPTSDSSCLGRVAFPREGRDLGSPADRDPVA